MLSGRRLRMLLSPDDRRRPKPGNTKVDHQHDIRTREQLATEEGRAVYPRRKSMIEPVFGQIKHNPPDRPVHQTTRVSGLPGGMAAGDSHPQLLKAPRPPDRDRLTLGMRAVAGDSIDASKDHRLRSALPCP